MDYPKSVPSAGLIDGKFVDEDLLTGKPGSLIPASWGNGVTQELLTVIQSAGLTPTEASNNQLLSALRSSNLFVTAPQFDKGKTVATTEFVARAGLQFSGFISYPTSTALTMANVGGVASFASTTPITATLPTINGITHASTLHVINAGNGVLTINPAANEQIETCNGTIGSLKLGLGDSACLIKLANQWRLYGGSVSDRYATAHSGINGNVGYQRFASGNIDQWGVGTTDAKGEVDITFPISFPTAFSSVVATHAGGDGAMVILIAGSGKQQGCKLKVRDFGGNVAAGWGINYFAKGY
ncbi:gp53-like domain-containing protein [Pseudomonas sp. MF6776]|uniref:gp53-like domain-containing protein n=1 Tax=Pseudomonas sp. MF6776 TaxID=2797534 RepID=UPI00190C3D63|nr:phage tail protein [Pseudomonas sp. MF6776]MBK3465182.1 phage tail protein [Pseudomonas sp. MF6776]